MLIIKLKDYEIFGISEEEKGIIKSRPLFRTETEKTVFTSGLNLVFKISK